ncbi:MAG: PLDc N-terminal domain-containing protein [Pseudomonadota bacterium]
MIEYLGLWVLLALSLNMWALLSVLGAQASITGKALWAAVLLALPGIAFFGWYLFGPRRA